MLIIMNRSLYWFPAATPLEMFLDDIPVSHNIYAFYLCAPRIFSDYFFFPIADMNRLRIVGDNNFGEQKTHHRCRRKKHDVRMLDSLR